MYMYNDILIFSWALVNGYFIRSQLYLSSIIFTDTNLDKCINKY